MKLGKRAPRHDPRTLQLAAYVKPSLPPPPASVDWTSKVAGWRMYLNDAIGDCTCATAAHMIQAWTASGQSHQVDVSDADVLRAYEAVGHYVPGQPATDHGAVELDVLRYWRKVGVGGHRIGAFAAVSPHNVPLMQDAVALFGGAYVGFALPESARSQRVWDVPHGGPHGAGMPGSWGGHAVPIVAYDARGLTCVTWGGLQRMSWAFLAAYCDEAYATVSEDFLHNGKAPNGLDVATLRADLALI